MQLMNNLLQLSNMHLIHLTFSINYNILFIVYDLRKCYVKMLYTTLAVERPSHHSDHSHHSLFSHDIYIIALKHKKHVFYATLRYVTPKISQHSHFLYT